MSKLDEKNGENILINKNENINNIKNIQENFIKKHSILSFLKEKQSKSTEKIIGSNTTLSSNFNFKEKEINKFDELNNSLRKISNFDLEKQEEENDSLSFNSSENNDDKDIEYEEIIPKELKKNKENDIEYELQIDEEFQEIEKDILMKKN